MEYTGGDKGVAVNRDELLERLAMACTDLDTIEEMADSVRLDIGIIRDELENIKETLKSQEDCSSMIPLV